jgi:hypothetical protein
MVAIKIENFGGEIPAIDNRLLPPNQAAEAVNVDLFTGRAAPTHALTPLHTLVDPSATAWFRLPIGLPSIDNMIDSYWLEFQNQNVRVIRSPVAGQDDDGRYYWADALYPKMMTGSMIAAGNPPLQLGTPPPETAPGVTSSGGVASTSKTVSYIYTWVSALGEEGPPSPPTTVTGLIDATYHVTMTAPLPADTANRNLATTRIYRTVVSVQGVASFYFVAEVPIATLTYADVITDQAVVNNEQLTTLYWYPPPADLQGLVSMPNGMVAGWRSNEVWFCEPYYPHAWPVPYTIAVPNTIVGLGVFGQSLIILTQGQPYSATGVDPSSMALAIIQPLEPCTARNSIVSTPAGVLYSSPNGLIMITPAGATNVTLEQILKAQWANLLNLDSINAGILAVGYYAYSGDTPAVFQDDSFQIDDAFQEQSAYSTRPGIYLSLHDQRQALMIMDPGQPIQNVITDIFNGEVMTLRNGVIYVRDLRLPQPIVSYRWRSKIFSLPYLQNLGAAKVYYTPPYDPAATTTFRVFAGEAAQAETDSLPLRFQEVLPASGQMLRLPSGYKALYWQFEIEGWAQVTAIHVASSARELRSV